MNTTIKGALRPPQTKHGVLSQTMANTHAQGPLAAANRHSLLYIHSLTTASDTGEAFPSA